MLHKRFKPAKCKTSLKLAISRIKLMKNKKAVQINQMKRDLSQLLDTSQDRTARIRVEHVIREEKMVAAYELIEIYCELIVARLPIIESQKICPLDLKEAVTSVIFAAPRCSDISELSDIRKHFTKKYGKEFVSAATELRPDCGVSRLLVEKLSAIAPDVQTKIKVLSDVAKEHNVKWDPTSFEEKESNPPNDLLNGPSGFEKTTADPPKIQAPSVDVVHSRKEKQDVPLDFAQQNKKYTLDTHNTTSTDSVGVETPPADTRSSGATSERMEMRQPVRRGKDDFSSGRENWNMEFKDATSAAQAAAESAERAAMAARAAAQFSRDEKIVKQYPTGSSSSDDRKPKILNQQKDQNEHGTSQKAAGRFSGTSHGSNTRSGRPTSDNDSVEDEKLVNNFHPADGYFEESLNQDQDSFHPKTTTLEGFEESKAELGSGKKESFESEDINLFAEESTTKKQPSDSGDELEVRKFAKTSVVGNPFAVFDERNLFSEATKTSSNLDSRKDDDDDDVDDNDNDDDDDDDDGGPRFDTGFEYDEVEAKSYLSSPTRSLKNDQMWNKNNTVKQVSSQSPLFSESVSSADHYVKYTEPLETDDQILASFDHSDSESETDLFSTNPEPLSVESTQDFNSRKTRIELNDLVERESSLNNKDQESVDRLEGGNDDLDARKELNFGTLTGGLRNKGGLTKSPATDLSKKLAEESSRTGEETSCLDSGMNRTEDKRQDVSIAMSSSDSDSDDYKFPVQSSSEKASKQANTRSRYPSSAFFGDDGTDSEEEVEVVGSKQPSSRVGLGLGISRRTKGPHRTFIAPRKTTEIGNETTSVREPKIPTHEPSRSMKAVESGKTKTNEGSSSVSYSKSHVELKPEAKTVISGSDEATFPVKKGSHVHPKLPDYDSIAARFESLRTSRQ